MRTINVNILGLCETIQAGAGEMHPDDKRIIYFEGNKHERGVDVILHGERAETVNWYMTISYRVLLVKLRCKPIYSISMQVSAPTADSAEEKMIIFTKT